MVPAVGYDHIDIIAATRQGIKVINCPTQNTSAVAEFTIALIFALARQIIPAHETMQKGNWAYSLYKGIELQGKTLGIIGYGRIGSQVGDMAKKLGMKVVHADSKTTPAALDKIIRVSDIISLHAPLTTHTHHILNARRLKLMKKGSYLINTARGAEIDQKALLTLLKSGHLAGAALDVFEKEPTNGVVDGEILEFAKLPNVIITPHNGFNTHERDIRLGKELLHNIKMCLKNTPQNIVN